MVASESTSLSEMAESAVAVALYKTAESIHAELTAIVDEYQAIETLNAATRDYLSDVSVKSQHLVDELTRLQETQKDIQPYLLRIADLEQQVAKLEHVALALDEYSRRVEDCVKRGGR
ncbi:hypothetical protein SeMB42_g07544 [Synchytrium endobioticum]|uniref:Biogenesis of lysosome-related organelles complex 1 subunit 2 n=1 Tax=Synchytrium endobioticum TaxID=286115 RepID=A0A507C0R0_9FUNG|nr:hypothetical protein SeMB42_g07544 [Synchytrium endobioticum]